MAVQLLHGQVRINELQCTRAPGSNGQGAAGDWVELYNAGSGTVELGGYQLALNGRSERLAKGLLIGPRAQLVLWCDAMDEPGHIALKLPRNGGTLLLVAPNGSDVLDLFQWPALPPGVSMGRRRDGGLEWGFFPFPTPGSANVAAEAKSRLLPTPAVVEQGQRITMEAGAGMEVRYTLDGSLPDGSSPLYSGPLEVPPGTVVRSRSFAADAVDGSCVLRTAALPDTAWALMMAPQDLSGAAGIADVPSGNFARRGRQWQRQAWLQRNKEIIPVGIAIAGNGSRSLPKRNFKLLVRDRFQKRGELMLPDSSQWDEVFLRADGTPHAFLRNVFMEEVAKRSGGRVDVQPSSALPLYLNGKYQGLYRAMPAKGKEWMGSLAGGFPADIIEGPGARAVSGKAMAYLRMVQAIGAGAALDSLEQWADLGSLVELACFDLWTGRADHELNVRCWRPRIPGGRWRWVMYDMDQWAPAEDRTVQRLCSSPVPETPFIPQLLSQPGLRGLLLARLSALAATTLSADRGAALADSLYFRYKDAMVQDHAHWAAAMEVPAPAKSRTELLKHIAARNASLLGQLADRTGLPLHKVSVEVEPRRSGQVLVEALPFTGSTRTMQAFAQVALHFKAMPSPGMEFAGWKGAEGDGDRLAVIPRSNMRITAVFRPVAVSRHGGGLQQRSEQAGPVGIP